MSLRRSSPAGAPRRGRTRAISVRLMRAYEPAGRSDGYRVLVDRLWPRGISRQRLRIDIWLKEAAPSAGLRTWFGHDARKWNAFKTRYFRELDACPAILEPIRALLSRASVTLVYAAKDPAFNNAVALKEYLETHPGRRVPARSGPHSRAPGRPLPAPRPPSHITVGE